MKAHKATGFGLVELMIAMALELILLAGILTLFQTTLQSSRYLATGKELESELHSTLDLITRDLRRIGAMGNPLRQLMGVINPFSIGTLSAFTGAAANSCLPYSYDLNGDGTLDTSSGTTDERFGYRLRQGVVQVRHGSPSCTTTSSGWTDVTTASLIEVTTLLFAVTTTTNLGVIERAAVINIGGRLVADNTITRSLSRTVRLRNDGYAP